MVRAIFRRFGLISRLLNALALIPVWMFRAIYYSFRWLRYVYLAHIHPLRLLGRVAPATLVALLAYEIGQQILNEDPAKVVVLVVCALFTGLVVSRLYIALGLYMVLLATIFYPSAVPKPITFGGAGLGLAEILLMLILFTAYIKAYGERRKITSPMKPAFTLLLLAILLAIGVSYREYQSNPRGFYDFAGAYNAGRALFPYAFFFGVLYGIRNKREFRTFFHIVLGLACFVALLMIAQYGIGRSHSLFFGSLTGTQSVQGLSREEEDITRTLPPGLALICPMFVTAVYLSATQKNKSGIIYGLLAALLAAGLALSFARNTWMAAGFALVGAMILSPRQVKWRLAILLMMVVGAGILFTIAVSTMAPGKGGNLSVALWSRFESIFVPNKIFADPNRLAENRQALKIIQANPIFGTGLGSIVRREFASKGFNKGFYPVSTTVIHNSWLDVWVHYGVFGLAAFAWLSAVFLWRAFRLWRKAEEEWIKCIGLMFGLNYITWLWRCNVAMMLINHQWEIAAAAFTWGMVEIASLLYIPKPESEQLRESAQAGMLELGGASRREMQLSGPRQP